MKLLSLLIVIILTAGCSRDFNNQFDPESDSYITASVDRYGSAEGGSLTLDTEIGTVLSGSVSIKEPLMPEDTLFLWGIVDSLGTITDTVLLVAGEEIDSLHYSLTFSGDLHPIHYSGNKYLSGYLITVQDDRDNINVHAILYSAHPDEQVISDLRAALYNAPDSLVPTGKSLIEDYEISLGQASSHLGFAMSGSYVSHAAHVYNILLGDGWTNPLYLSNYGNPANNYYGPKSYGTLFQTYMQRLEQYYPSGDSEAHAFLDSMTVLIDSLDSRLSLTIEYMDAAIEESDHDRAKSMYLLPAQTTVNTIKNNEMNSESPDFNQSGVSNFKPYFLRLFKVYLRMD